MIRAYDIVTEQYIDIKDYIASLSNEAMLGIEGSITAMAFHPLGSTVTCTAHGFLKGQKIAIDGTTDYDGEYYITQVTDVDNFVINATFVSDETGSVYPVMDSDYYIAFLTGIEEIFTHVKKVSALKGKSVKDGNGNIMISEYELTEDRRDVFEMLLNRASDEIASPFTAYSRRIINAYKFNAYVNLDGDDTVTGDGETLKYIQFTIEEDKAYQIQEQFAVLDKKIEECLISFVMKEWYYMNSLMNDFSIEEQRYYRSLQELKSSLIKIEGKKKLTQTIV